MIIVGLTGNYGMGKSSVTSIFGKLGAITINSDEIVADLLKETMVRGRIRRLFGPGVISESGCLDKGELAKIIFSDVSARNKIEAFLHPLVFKKVDVLIRNIRDNNAIIIVEVPLLFEGGYKAGFDRTITVFTTQKKAIERLKKKGISGKDALARLNTQMHVRVKKRLSDYTIDNNGTKRQTEMMVKRVFHALMEENTLRISKGPRRL
jgi:dephospho-CoA kinase